MTTKPTKLKLISWTQHPVETIYTEWTASRTKGEVLSPENVHQRILAERHMYVNGGPYEAGVRKVFQDVIDMKIPVSETLFFVFLADNVPIALREQWVRHRVVHKFGHQIGADIIPDIHESTWWSQTMRVLDMGEFASEGEYFVPESVVKSSIATTAYSKAMEYAQIFYNALVKCGVPIEDARNVLPLATHSRLSWSTNLSSIMHLLSKRGCWIAQLGMWEPVIHDIVNELSTKIDPYFRKLIDPPCIGTDGKFETCRFKLENEVRMAGKDPYPPCPLWLHNDLQPYKGHVRTENEAKTRWPEYPERRDKYIALWGRDAVTGERIQLT